MQDKNLQAVHRRSLKDVKRGRVGHNELYRNGAHDVARAAVGPHILVQEVGTDVVANSRRPELCLGEIILDIPSWHGDGCDRNGDHEDDRVGVSPKPRTPWACGLEIRCDRPGVQPSTDGLPRGLLTG